MEKEPNSNLNSGNCRCPFGTKNVKEERIFQVRYLAKQVYAPSFYGIAPVDTSRATFTGGS